MSKNNSIFAKEIKNKFELCIFGETNGLKNTVMTCMRP